MQKRPNSRARTLTHTFTYTHTHTHTHLASLLLSRPHSLRHAKRIRLVCLPISPCHLIFTKSSVQGFGGQASSETEVPEGWEGGLRTCLPVCSVGSIVTHGDVVQVGQGDVSERENVQPRVYTPHDCSKGCACAPVALLMCLHGPPQLLGVKCRLAGKFSSHFRTITASIILLRLSLPLLFLSFCCASASGGRHWHWC